MQGYRKGYLLLFNAITDGLRALDSGDIEAARAILVQAQQMAEETWIGSSDTMQPV